MAGEVAFPEERLDVPGISRSANAIPQDEYYWNREAYRTRPPGRDGRVGMKTGAGTGTRCYIQSNAGTGSAASPCRSQVSPGLCRKAVPFGVFTVTARRGSH